MGVGKIPAYNCYNLSACLGIVETRLLTINADPVFQDRALAILDEVEDLETQIVRNLSEAVQALLEEEPDLQLIDVRESYEREAGYIDGSRHIELMKLSSEAATLERERPVVFYCRVGSRSEMAAQALRTAGFEAYSMSGGLMRWAREQRALGIRARARAASNRTRG